MDKESSLKFYVSCETSLLKLIVSDRTLPTGNSNHPFLSHLYNCLLMDIRKATCGIWVCLLRLSLSVPFSKVFPDKLWIELDLAFWSLCYWCCWDVIDAAIKVLMLNVCESAFEHVCLHWARLQTSPAQLVAPGLQDPAVYYVICFPLLLLQRNFCLSGHETRSLVSE